MSTTFVSTAMRSSGLHGQRGLTMTSTLFILCVGVFMVTFAFKAAPAYYENWTVVKVVDQVMSDRELANGPRKAIYRRLNEQFDHNNLWALEAENVVELQRGETSTYTAKVAYEKRETLFSNIDLIMSFDNGAEAP